MDQDLINYIADLSMRDKKTLSEKALKVAEETGELARVILPFDNAPGTTHRFIEKEKILEESADVMLTAMSIPLSMGFEFEDLVSMIRHKSIKWQKIQTKEESVDYPLPFEIHITVKRPENISKFVSDCKDKLKVKPIVLDLQNGGEVIIEDVMTSSHCYGTNASSYIEAKRLSFELLTLGYEVVREKIESVPWHPMAPSNDSHSTKMPQDCYFEAHIGVLIKNLEEKASLEEIAKSNDSHLSSNAFKKNPDGSSVMMVTLREKKGTREVFDANLEKLKDSLLSKQFSYEKVITEFAIYDTNVSHDFPWLKK